MAEKAYTVAPPDYSDRRNPVFFVAKNICLLGHRVLVRPHLEMDPRIVELKRRGGAVFLYCGLHRSLWETSGIMPPLYHAGVPLPYVGMGDNLVHGRVFQKMSKMIGTFLVERPASRREVLESARKLRSDILSFVAHGIDVMVFPEGTRKNIPAHSRYGEFYPAVFDAMLEYERNKAAIVAGTPGLSPLDSYVVPLNVDYSRVREAVEMVSEQSGAPRTLNVLDSFSMLRGIGDTWLTYGAPIPVADHLDLNRKTFASFCRDRCLELVKILPINVASRAMLELAPAAAVAREELHTAVRRVLDALRPFADRCRGFSVADEPGVVVERAVNDQLGFTSVTPENRPLYRLYASYIGHYVGAAGGARVGALASPGDEG